MDVDFMQKMQRKQTNKKPYFVLFQIKLKSFKFHFEGKKFL